MRLATVLLTLASGLLVSNAAAAPCTSVADCTEWVALGGGPARSMVYRSYPLGVRNQAVTRALVMIHGASRDADNYFRTALASAFLAGRLEDTVLVVPRLASTDGNCHDQLAENEIAWPCSGASWRAGGVAPKNPSLNSFDFVDEILRKLARKDAFPNLQSIVVVGHSAGGQFVNRYSMANTVHETLGVPVEYVVSNPSSYGYVDADRPRGETGEFGLFSDGRNCTTFNQWPYGFEKRSGYTAKVSDEQLKRNLATRPISYLLGEIDILPLGGFDGSCPAMAQGPTRRARGEAYRKYVEKKLGVQQPIVVAHLCGHNARCMFTADEAMPLLYPTKKK
jgi:hypothetical protein